MCGIAGVWHPDRAIAVAAVQAMNRAQVHRGPDDEGLEVVDLPGGSLALGHRRLAIIDLSPAGHQPMTNPQTGDWVVFNGEIYNFPELRSDLSRQGAVFRSHSDTEAILHAFACWGCGCFERLHGMFALALYDARNRQLVLARDHLGIKPLYYAWTPAAFVFASEVRALASSGLIDTTLDRRAIAGLLAYGAVPQPLTMFRQSKALEPGTWLAAPLQQPEKKTPASCRYWRFPAPTAVGYSPEQLAEQIHDRLRTSFKAHLLSDVPVGLFLSSGLDSSALAVLCQETGSREVRAFTVSLPLDAAADESDIAEATARQLGVRHERIIVADEEVLARTQQFLNQFDQPSVDGLNTYLIAGAVRQRGITVALSGLGGDEVFAGYSTFRDVPRLLRWSRLLRWLPRPLVGALARCVMRGSAQQQKAIEFRDTSPRLRSMYFRRRRLLSDAELATLGFRAADLELDEDFLPPECNPEQDLPADDPVAAIGVLESRFYMGNTLLRDSDVCGMAHGLEIRVPLLDQSLLQAVWAVPGNDRLARRGPNKQLLVRAIGKQLPAQLLKLPKLGFTLPYSRWMAGPLRELFVDALAACQDAEIADNRGIRQVWQRFEEQPNSPNWSRAWILGMLGTWLARNKQTHALAPSLAAEDGRRVNPVIP